MNKIILLIALVPLCISIYFAYNLNYGNNMNCFVSASSGSSYHSYCISNGNAASDALGLLVMVILTVMITIYGLALDENALNEALEAPKSMHW